MAIKQTAGHDALGKFAPEFAHLNDDILFGEVWSREDKLPLKLRSIVTVSALIGKGIVDSSLKYHLASAKKNGVTQEEMAEILTHIAFYAGWPNVWAAFNMAKEVYVEDGTDGTIGEGSAGDTAGSGSPESHGGFFGLGKPNDAFAQYFIALVPGAPEKAVATIGISIMRAKAAGKCSSAWMAKAGTKKRASPPSACAPATWWRFPRTSSIGMAPLPIAGSATSPSSTPARMRATSGSNLWTTALTTHFPNARGAFLTWRRFPNAGELSWPGLEPGPFSQLLGIAQATRVLSRRFALSKRPRIPASVRKNGRGPDNPTPLPLYRIDDKL